MMMICVGNIVETDFFYHTHLKTCWQGARYKYQDTNYKYCVTRCKKDHLCQSGLMIQVNPVTPGAPYIDHWLDSGWFKIAESGTDSLLNS